MAKIDIKRQNDSPMDGKAKIWFCAHPEDAAGQLDGICHDLFRAGACVVYYDSEPEGEYDADELCRDISQMNLFVVAVTEKFLGDWNRAREVEFKFARENGIRIIPILIDGGIDEKFNRLCGDLHLLKRGAGNYHEELSKLMSSAPLSADEVDRIRAEFVKRIFFSYRKMDRDAAIKLIRLIRKNEFCRDVSIWYDDYLSVGEKFNRQIMDALHKCDLFVLAITENITEKTVDGNGKRVNNYVVAHEFPTARDGGKRILPLRMANISQKKLEVFRGLPPYVNAKNERALADALIRGLGPEILEKRKNKARHDYYIGLAYLYGIDVEVDRSVAFSLIKSSAERGYPVAMKRLADMYRRGNGVRMDYSRALVWQRAAVEKYRALANGESGHFSLAAGYFAALYTLCEYLSEVGASDEIKRQCEDALVIAKKFYSHSPDALTRRFVAMVHSMLAENYLHCGDFGAALENAHESRRLREQNSAEEWDDPDDLLYAYTLLERIYSAMGDAENRMMYRKKALAIKESAPSGSETDYAFGVLNERDSLMAEDGMHLEKHDDAIAILEQQCERNPSDENRRRLADGYSRYAGVLSSRLRNQRRTSNAAPPVLRNSCSHVFDGEGGREERFSLFAAVIDLNKKSIEIYEDIAERTGVAADLRKLANTYREMAEFIRDIISEYEKGDGRIAESYTDSDRYFARAIELYFEIVSRTNYADDKNTLVEIIAQRAEHIDDMYLLGLIDKDRVYEGIALLEEGERLAKELFSLSENREYENNFISLYISLQCLYNLVDDTEKADYYGGLIPNLWV